MVAALALAGCADASDDPGPQGQGEDTGLLPPAEQSTSYPLTLETPFGDSELEQRPERIAVITASTMDTDALVALGAIPVLAPSTVDRNVWLEASDTDRIETLWASEAGEDVPAEQIAAAEPDLIVSLAAYDTFDQDRFDQLSAIAPVLYASAGELNWQEITRTLGQALDLGATAQDVVSSVDETVAQVRATHPEFEGRTAAHVLVYDQDYGAVYASAPGTDSAELFEQLGLELPQAAQEFVADDTISDELAGLIDADFLLLSIVGAEPEYFTEAPLVQAVPAIADERVAVNPSDPQTGVNHVAWGLNVQSALSVPWLIEQLADFGAQALEQ